MKHNLPDLVKVSLLFLCISLGSPIVAQTYANLVIHQKAASSSVQYDSERRSLSKILFMLEENYQVSFNYDDETIKSIYLSEDFNWEKKEKLEKILDRLLPGVHLKFEKLDKKNYLIFDSQKNPRVGSKRRLAISLSNNQIPRRPLLAGRMKSFVSSIHQYYPSPGLLKMNPVSHYLV